MHNPKISRTSNYLENYYRQTLPKSKQKEIQNNPRTNQLSKTQNAKMDPKTRKTSPTPNNLTASIICNSKVQTSFY
jgi:hypothetical protein